MAVGECVSESLAPQVTLRPFICDPERGIESTGSIALVTDIKDELMTEDFATNESERERERTGAYSNIMVNICLLKLGKEMSARFLLLKASTLATHTGHF